MPRKKQSEKLISTTEVYDKVEELLRKKYSNLHSFEMPYCSLIKDIKTNEKIYRVQVELNLKDELFKKNAIMEVTADRGTIIMFKEGYSWQYWV